VPECSLLGRTHVNDFSVNEFPAAYPDNIYFKTGRTTGLTIGTYSHIQSYVEISLPFNSNDAKPPKRVTDEHVIVCPGENGVFSDDGDSGAWLLDRYGYLSALIWGSNSKDHCYATPISLIMEDIEGFTGGTVEVL
jgi:hypothetical protein